MIFDYFLQKNKLFSDKKTKQKTEITHTVIVKKQYDNCNKKSHYLCT